MAVKCPETKFQVSPLDGWCLDPKFFCESVGNMCQLKEPMLTMPKFRAKWAVLVHNGVTFLFTPKKECQLKELPLTEVTGLSFRRSFVSSISHISLICSWICTTTYRSSDGLSFYKSIRIKHLKHNISRWFDKFCQGWKYTKAKSIDGIEAHKDSAKPVSEFHFTSFLLWWVFSLAPNIVTIPLKLS